MSEHKLPLRTSADNSGRSTAILNDPNLKEVVTSGRENPHTTLGNSRKPITGLTEKGLRGIFALHLADSVSSPSRQDPQDGAAVLRRIHQMTA
jgi:hypothetical protein